MGAKQALLLLFSNSTTFGETRMTNPFQRAAAARVEDDARIEEARKIEEQLRQLREQRQDLDSQILILEVNLQGSLGDFYTLQRASEKLSEDPRTLTKMMRNGAIFGVKMDGKWYVEKEEVDTKAEFI